MSTAVSRAREPWEDFADVLLTSEVGRVRAVEGREPSDFAGLYVAEVDVDRALAGLAPGGDPPTTPPAALEEARRRLHEHIDGALATVVAGAGLSTSETEVLALLAAVEVGAARQRLLGYLQDDVQLTRCTLGFLDRLLPGAALSVQPGSLLRRTGMVVVEEGPVWSRRACGLPERVVWAFLGSDNPDPGLAPGTIRRPGRVRRGVPGLFLVSGGDRETRRQVLGGAAVISPWPGDADQWAAVVREATLGGQILVLENDRPLDAAGCDALDGARHVTCVISSQHEPALDVLPRRPFRELVLHDAQPGPQEWADVGLRAPEGVSLTRDQLRVVAALAGGDQAAVPAAVRRLVGGYLDGPALRVRPRRGWDDLVLPAQQTAQLRELVSRQARRDVVMERWGFSAIAPEGVVALFAGPSGTGKTLAAEVVAGELGLDLYKIDLSSVVSKYIGETERNLERIFTAASAGELVLFFDEADALFGKRSEVSDAHDRYANIEVAYLLQRLERYDGLVVLATNMQRNIDPAFLRRITVGVDFPAPDEAQRLSIWRLAFPSAAPVRDLDLPFLARQFRLTGGVIRNTALAAAFLAADEDAEIGMRHVVLALRREFQKIGRLHTVDEFGPWFALVDDGASKEAV